VEKTDPVNVLRVRDRGSEIQILSPRLKHWTKTNLKPYLKIRATEARASSKSRPSVFVPNRHVLDIMAPAKDL